jgi:hypothetical protein
MRGENAPGNRATGIRVLSKPPVRSIIGPMVAFAYEQMSHPIRSDIPRTNRAVWEHIASAGCWWTGNDRVAMAAEVRRARHCALCSERKDSLAPYSIPGAHDQGHDLPPDVVEVVHRVATDSGRLKKSWYDDLVNGGLTDAQYVEILSVVVVIVAVDEFHHALGLPLEPLPQPEPGQPSGYRPPGAKAAGAWVPMILLDGAIDQEADLYGGGKQIVNVVSALSLVPDAVRMADDILSTYYVAGADLPNLSKNGGRALQRSQMEFIAARVSSINDCFY